MGVATAQTVPTTAWSLFAPRNVPTVEWSSDGSSVVLTTNSAVEVLNGATLTLKWARQVTGTEPTISSTYGYSDRAHFSPDGSTVWVRTAGGSTFTQFNTATGLPVKTHVFNDWTTDNLLVPVGSELLAYNVTLSGSTFTYKYTTYDATTLATLQTGTLTHASASGYGSLTIPTGVYGGTDMAFFFDQGINLKTGAVTNFDVSGTQEAWAVGVDPQGGLIQALFNVSGTTYTSAGARRLTSGGVTWSNAISYPGSIGPSPYLGFLSSPSTPIAVAPTSTGIAGLNYMTGTPLYSTSLGVSAFAYEPTALNPVDGRLLLTTGTASFAKANMATYMVSAASLGSAVPTSAVVFGVAGAAAHATGVLVDGESNFLSSFSQGGTGVWSSTTLGGPLHVAASPAGDLAALVLSDRIRVVNTADGTTKADYMGTFKAVVWGTETQLLGIQNNDGAVYLTVGASTITLAKSYPTDFHVGHAISSDGKYLVGYANGNLYSFDLTNFLAPPVQSTYSLYTTPWDDSFEILAMGDGRMAFLEQTGNGSQWSIYHFIPNGSSGVSIGKVSAYAYTAPFARGTNDRVRGDIAPDYSIAAYFIGGSVGTDGTPTSELAFVRLSDGKVLSKLDNVFSYIGSMKFSPDKSVLYVATGGPSATGTPAINDSGPMNMLALNVPAWITSITASSTTVFSGQSTTLTVTLNVPAKAGGQIVNLTAPAGVTIPATMTVPAGQTSGTVVATLPTLSATATYTISGAIAGLGESASVTITDNPATLASVTLASGTIQAGSQTVGTATLNGFAPTGGIKVTLADSDPTVTIGASATIPAGAGSATFAVKTQGSTTAPSNTVTGTYAGVSKTATLNLTPTQVMSVVFESASVTGGDAVAANITLGGVAPTGGFTLSLASSNPAVSYPATVTVPAGKSTIEVTGTTVPVASSTQTTLTVTLGTKTGSAKVTVIPPVLLAASLAQHSIVGGNSVSMTALLNGAAAAGTNLTVHSSSARLTAPATVAVPAGNSFVSWTMTTTAGATTTATVTVTFAGVTFSDTVTIKS